MTIINCLKLKKKLEGLDYQPYPGELGKKIHENVKNFWKILLNKKSKSFF